jgi:hypothetical protein
MFLGNYISSSVVIVEIIVNHYFILSMNRDLPGKTVVRMETLLAEAAM